MKNKETLEEAAELPEGFIVTSNEEIKTGDIKWHHVTGLRKALVDGNYTNQFKVIAQQNQIDFSALSEEEQKEIELINIDLSNLCFYDRRNPDFQIKEEFGYDKEEVESTGNFAKKDCFCDNCFYGRSKLTEQLIKAQELLSDRRFTLEDINNAYDAGMKFIGEDKGSPIEFIQSLSQPKSWKVKCIEENGKIKLTKVI
jgi:hypothetical protein